MKEFSPEYRGTEFSGPDKIREVQEKLFRDHLDYLSQFPLLQQDTERP